MNVLVPPPARSVPPLKLTVGTLFSWKAAPAVTLTAKEPTVNTPLFRLKVYTPKFELLLFWKITVPLGFGVPIVSSANVKLPPFKLIVAGGLKKFPMMMFPGVPVLGRMVIDAPAPTLIVDAAAAPLPDRPTLPA